MLLCSSSGDFEGRGWKTKPGGVRQILVDLAGDVALEAADDLGGGDAPALDAGRRQQAGALRLAVDEAALRGVRLIGLHSFDPTPMVAGAGPWPLMAVDVDPQLEAFVRETMAPALEGHPEVAFEVRVGQARASAALSCVSNTTPSAAERQAGDSRSTSAAAGAPAPA